MKIFNKRVAVWTAVLTLSGIVSYHFMVDSGRHPNGSQKANAPSRPSLLGPASRVPVNEVPSASLDAKLHQFKERWIALQKETPLMHVFLEEHYQLAEESVAELLCSEETMELIEFLETNHFGGATQLFDISISNLLVSSRAPEARAALLATDRSRRKIMITDEGPLEGNKYREDWSFDAGKGCDAREFASFSEALQDLGAARNAFYGYQAASAKQNPEAAVASILNVLLQDAGGSKASAVLPEIIPGLPESTDFEQLCGLFSDPRISRTDEEDVSLRHGQSLIFSRWSEGEPVKAAQYILDHAGELNPALMTTVIGKMTNSDPVFAMDWIQNLPDGPYFDHAAIPVVEILAESNPKEARELVSRIQDTKMRQEQLQFISGIRTRARELGIVSEP